MKIVKINNSIILDMSQVAAVFASIQNGAEYVSVIIKAQMGEPKEFRYASTDAENVCDKIYEALREFHKKC
jgi:hypothetical protein